MRENLVGDALASITTLAMERPIQGLDRRCCHGGRFVEQAHDGAARAGGGLRADRNRGLRRAELEALRLYALPEAAPAGREGT